MHKFWDEQPQNDNTTLCQNRHKNTAILDQSIVKDHACKLPTNFNWSTEDLSNHLVMNDIYNFLCSHYVTDSTGTIRLNYSINFLKWALCVPNMDPEWSVGVRTNNGKLVAYISAVPLPITIHDKDVDAVGINFLCIHKKLRDKRLAPVLIQEITRRVNMKNIWQAVFTNGINLPGYNAICNYYSRILDVKYLHDNNFMSKQDQTFIRRYNKLLTVHTDTTFRRCTQNDVPCVVKLLQHSYQDKPLKRRFTDSFVSSIVNPHVDGVVYSYINNTCTDFISFYILQIKSCCGDNIINAGMMYYNAHTTLSESDLLREAMSLCKIHGCHIFKCLNIFSSSDDMYKEIKFQFGAQLNYYIFNWNIDKCKPTDIGIYLL